MNFTVRFAMLCTSKSSNVGPRRALRTATSSSISGMKFIALRNAARWRSQHSCPFCNPLKRMCSPLAQWNAAAEGRNIRLPEGTDMELLLTHGYFLYEDPKELQIMKPYPPLGILYICAHLRNKGLSVEVFDSTFSSRQQLWDVLKQSPPS